jgi:hypothetical protein
VAARFVAQWVDDVHTFEAPENKRRMAMEARDFFFRYLSGPQ